MAESLTSFDRACVWRGNHLEVSRGNHSYVVTFNERFNHLAIPLQNLCTWLRKVEQVINTRMEFIRELVQIKEHGVHKKEMEAYRFSSRLYNQMRKIANIEDIVSINLVAAVPKRATKEEPNAKSTGVIFLGPINLSEVGQAEAEKSYLGIKKVVEETLEQLDTLTVYKRAPEGGPIADFREFNTIFSNAKETFDKFKIFGVTIY
ncbi:MAG TPA: hypothetical protein VLG44_03660 [Chlamydiales bacterium]|nr:hypothetical protein [Chlamydiales bacterium]